MNDKISGRLASWKPRLSLLLPVCLFLAFLGMALFFPVGRGANCAYAAMTKGSSLAREIFARLYRNLESPEIQDFSADFYVKENQSPEYVATADENDLTPFSKGRLFFKKPYYLRVESSMLYPAGLEGADFVEIRNGKFIYAYKNGVDLPIAEDVDNPTQPSNYIPFGLQLPIMARDLQITLLGENNSLGVKTYILGLMDRTDPDHDILKVWVDGKHYFVRRTEWYDLRQKKSTMQIASSSGNISIYNNAVIKVTTIYQDPLRLPNGYWIPMRIERYENWSKHPQSGDGNLAQVVVYSQVSVNSDLADTLFEAPQPRLPMPISTFLGGNNR